MYLLPPRHFQNVHAVTLFSFALYHHCYLLDFSALLTSAASGTCRPSASLGGTQPRSLPSHRAPPAHFFLAQPDRGPLPAPPSTAGPSEGSSWRAPSPHHAREPRPQRPPSAPRGRRVPGKHRPRRPGPPPDPTPCPSAAHLEEKGQGGKRRGKPAPTRPAAAAGAATEPSFRAGKKVETYARRRQPSPPRCSRPAR